MQDKEAGFDGSSTQGPLGGGRRFTKPKIGDPPTRYIMVSGVGSATNTAAETIASAFTRFGVLDCSLPEPPLGVELVNNARFCFVSFSDVDGAISAVNTLGAGGYLSELGSTTKVFARYSALVGPPSCSANDLIECTSATDDIQIEGLHVIPNFLSEEDEERLLTSIGHEENGPWLNDLTRRVQHYGFIFNYRTLMLDYATQIDRIPPTAEAFLGPIDAVVQNLYSSSQLTEKSSIQTDTGEVIYPGGDYKQPLPFSQLTVNEYYPGQGIAAHIDTESCLGPDIAVLCLGSGVTMTMQHRKAMSLLIKSSKASKEPTAHALKSKEPKGPKPVPTPPKFRGQERMDRKKLKKLLKKVLLPPGTTSLPAEVSADTNAEEGNGDDDEVVNNNFDADSSSQSNKESRNSSNSSNSNNNSSSGSSNDAIIDGKDNSSTDSIKLEEELPTEPSTGLSSGLDHPPPAVIDPSTLLKKHVWLPRRCLLILRGEARYFWSHQIAPRKCDRLPGGLGLVPRERRVSLTFRQVLVPNEIPSCRLVSSKLETDNVFNVYDSIAVHWNHTRGKRKVYWHKVKDFIDNLEDGSIVADVGCGDGKYFGVNPRITVIGCDRSIKLLEVSKETSHNTFCCDAVRLPLTSNSFDASLCIAVMHHLATVDRRSSVIRELVRITRPGGEIMIQAWAQEQEEESRFQFDDPQIDSQDIFVPWKLNEKYVIPADNSSSDGANQTKIAAKENNCSPEGAGGECSSPPSLASTSTTTTTTTTESSSSSSAKATGKSASLTLDPNLGTGPDDKYVVFQRYCHVYKRGELEDLCSSIPCIRLVESGWDKGNWFVRLMKVDDTRLVDARRGPMSAVPSLASRLDK